MLNGKPNSDYVSSNVVTERTSEMMRIGELDLHGANVMLGSTVPQAC